MTQAVTPGYAETINSSQVPTTATFETIPSPLNTGSDGIFTYVIDQIVATSANLALRLIAPESGQILGFAWANGSVAADGTNGIRILVQNASNSNAELADFGIGSNTNAAAANDKTTSLAASATTEIANTGNSTAYFNKGDAITITGTRDGTTLVGCGNLYLRLGSQGR